MSALVYCSTHDLYHPPGLNCWRCDISLMRDKPMIDTCTNCGSTNVKPLPTARREGSVLFTDQCSDCETSLGVEVRQSRTAFGAQANAKGVKQLSSEIAREHGLNEQIGHGG